MTFLHPHIKASIDNGLQKKVTSYLTRVYSLSAGDTRKSVSGEILQWGKLRVLDGGDTVHACKLVSSSTSDERRDATFIKVCHKLCSASKILMRNLIVCAG